MAAVKAAAEPPPGTGSRRESWSKYSCKVLSLKLIVMGKIYIEKLELFILTESQPYFKSKRQKLLGIQGGHAAGPGGCHGLTVNLVLHISGGKYALHARFSAAGFCFDIPCLI